MLNKAKGRPRQINPVNPRSQSLVSPIALSCHFSTPCDAIGRFGVDVRQCRSELSLVYSIDGEVDALCVPEPVPPGRADGLWRETCFEVFLKASFEASDYVECNFSPSTRWAVYRFQDYRQQMTQVDRVEPPRIAVSRSAGCLRLEAAINLHDLSMPAEGDGLRLGLAAVIREKCGRLSYWAYAHGPQQLDFHHPQGFALRLANV